WDMLPVRSTLRRSTSRALRRPGDGRPHPGPGATSPGHPDPGPAGAPAQAGVRPGADTRAFRPPGFEGITRYTESEDEGLAVRLLPSRTSPQPIMAVISMKQLLDAG